MAKTKATSKAQVYRLKITLRDIRPPVWRRIEVPGDTRLDQLHLMFQAAMGWMNCHLHSISIGDLDYGRSDPEFDTDMENEKKFRLQNLIQKEKTGFRYVYDFGDDWEHDVLVEQIAPQEPRVEYPRCLAGSRACPPEDVGSTIGYEHFLEAIRDPEHDEHDELLEWIGGSFDPDAFDVGEADADLKNYKILDAETA